MTSLSPEDGTLYPHAAPMDGMECLVTMEDITSENYVEYRTSLDSPWKPALIEQAVVERLIRTQFHSYRERVEKTDCQAELRRLLAKGPPVYVSDPHGLPVDDPNADSVIQLWFCSDNSIRSGKLDGALEGEEREMLWEEFRKFLVEAGVSDDEREEVNAEDK